MNPTEVSHFLITGVQAAAGKKQDFQKILPTQLIIENIIVIGTEQHYTNPANKLMFAAHAVSTIKKSHTKGKLTVLMFSSGYSANCIDAVKKAVNLYNKDAVMILLQSTAQFVNYLNTGDRFGILNIRKDVGKVKGIKIGTLVSYSHGVTLNVTYLLTNQELNSGTYTNEFGALSVSQLNEDSFLPLISQFFFYSCRTGIGTYGEDVRIDGPQIKKSLAQLISNKLKVMVFAFPSRTDYTDTWGTKEERRYYENNYYIYDILNDKPSNYDSFEKMRKKEVLIDNKYPWNDKGAYYPVKAGTTPLGAQYYHMVTFVPQ